MKAFHLLFCATMLAIPPFAFAQDHSDHSMGHGGHTENETSSTAKLELIAQPLEPGKRSEIALKLTSRLNGEPLMLEDLEEAHTKKLHLLVIDDTLTDYHHLHPEPGKNPGEYITSFTPLLGGTYRVFADIKPVATGQQEYAVADLQSAMHHHDAVNPDPEQASETVDGLNEKEALVKMNGLSFTLSIDNPLKAGEAAMGRVIVRKDGAPFTQLEPLMGAYAHIVGFHEDRRSVVHVHPLGREPEAETERGGPELRFHIEPGKAGFTALFVQVQVNQEDIFVPFGLAIR